MTMYTVADYPTFVKDRFKSFLDGSSTGLALTLHHATTGMSGEVVEMETAITREAFLKECGDFEFYLEAFKQEVGGDIPEGFVPDMPMSKSLLSITFIAGDLLDLTKKAWVYEQEPRWGTMREYISLLRAHLDSLYTFFGTSYEEVISLNISKLLKRYPAGYSNEAAKVRADGDVERHEENPNV
jgi:hypothetical protein